MTDPLSSTRVADPLIQSPLHPTPRDRDSPVSPAPAFQLLTLAAAEVAKVDDHFLGNPPQGRPLGPDEIEMLRNRNAARALITSIRDFANLHLEVSRHGPEPFRGPEPALPAELR